MNEKLYEIFESNPIYKNAYYDFLEIHKNNHGKDSTEEQLAEFEKYFARVSTREGIKRSVSRRQGCSS